MSESCYENNLGETVKKIVFFAAANFVPLGFIFGGHKGGQNRGHKVCPHTLFVGSGGPESVSTPLLRGRLVGHKVCPRVQVRWARVQVPRFGPFIGIQQTTTFERSHHC